VPPEDEGGVQVLGLEESAGRQWKEVYLGGLMDGKFPQRQSQNIFLPEATLETLGVHTLERARLNAAYHFYRLLLSAGKVTLTWPENEGDRPVIPSPFLEELTPLKKAGLVNRGIEKTSGVQCSLKLEESRSLPELEKAVAIKCSAENSLGVPPRTEWLAELSNRMPDVSSRFDAIKSAIEFKAIRPAPAVAPRQKREFRVTELDEYINCPYDYYVKRILKIAPLEEVTEDMSPLERGSKVHAILRQFYEQWKEPVTPDTRAKAGEVLFSLAERAFRHEADTLRNRREKEAFLSTMAERFLDAEVEFWKQGFKPAYLEQKLESFTVSLSDGTEAEIRAKVDRIDADGNGNFIIVDYKTGRYPQPKMDLDQEIFQLPVYAVMAREIPPGKDPALKKPVGLAYYDLSGKTGQGARDVVLFDRDSTNEQPSSKPKASPKGAEEFETILQQSMDKARKAIEGILAGDFKSKPRDENKCRYCPNEVLCGNEEP
jgi:ATP-dependent helicase/nuclease subunit B